MRKTCNSGETTEFKFNRPALAYRVKNFTTGAIYHTYKPDFILDEASKIASNFGEDVEIMEFVSKSEVLTVKVKADETGEVEVQPTKY